MALVDGNRSPERYFSRQLAGFVPSFFRDVEKIRRGAEAGRSTTYPGASFWETFDMYLEQRLPFNVGDDSPPKRYWDGDIILAGGGEALHIYNTVSPIKVTYARSDKASERMVANGVKVSPPNSKVTISRNARTRVDLMRLDNGRVLYDQLIELVGKRRRTLVDRVVNARGFDELDNVEQKQKIELELAKGLDIGKRELLGILIKDPPSVEKYGPNAALFNLSELKALFNKMKRGNLEPDEEKLLKDAGTRGISGRSEIFVPQVN